MDLVKFLETLGEMFIIESDLSDIATDNKDILYHHLVDFMEHYFYFIKKEEKININI